MNAEKEHRSGKLPHDLDLGALEDLAASAERAVHRIAEDREVAENPEFDALMRRISGGITLGEARFLAARAADVPADGTIVEVGSFRGKSAAALSIGARHGGAQVHCIEPHRTFKGALTGQFGPQDRAQFYAAMLAVGGWCNTALINLKSEELAPDWPGPVALCFIDGDHRYDGVRRDFEHWGPRVAPGGLLVFDDATLKKAGPAMLLAEILPSPIWTEVPAPGKFRALRRTGVPAQPCAPGQNLLVVCDRAVGTGGLIRFRRLAQALAPHGHAVRLLPLQPGPLPASLQGLGTVTEEEAAAARWDAVMVPGAGFGAQLIARLERFRRPGYGLRVQHLLNDTSRRDGFLAVNAIFAPDLMIANTPVWQSARMDDFPYGRLETLVGAVDTAFFAPHPARVPLGDVQGEIVIGGQAGKNPRPLLAAMNSLPERVKLRVFGKLPEGVLELAEPLQAAGRLHVTGPLDDGGLREFYHGLDIAVGTELWAGWANMPAEAAACGIPLITTEHGTASFARHSETALIMETPKPAAIVEAVNATLAEPEAARARAAAARAAIAGCDWASYAAGLLRLLRAARG